MARSLVADRRGTIAVIFAFSVMPLMLMVALAVEYGFYIQARAQLNLAADAAAMHAVRVASQAYANGYTTVSSEQTAGQTAGQQWFTAQAGTTPVNVNAVPTVSVSYVAAPESFNATVSYTAAMPSLFGGIIPASLAFSGSSSGSTQAQYVEIIMLVDNSPSMLLGATDSDIGAMEKATPCSTQAATAGQDMVSYAWVYNTGYGYPDNNNNETATPPPVSPVNGSCLSTYTSAASADGLANQCFYVPSTLSSVIRSSTGRCANSNGTTNTSEGLNGVPQAPCAFACHNNANNNDYYGLARATTNPSTGNLVQLRLDVVHSAAEQVIQTLINDVGLISQFSVGYYEFNQSLTKVYPTSGSAEAGTGLSAALTAVQNLSPPLVSVNQAATYFTTSANTLASQLTAAGNGLSATAPIKNLMIVTDGVQNQLVNGTQQIGPFTSSTNEQTCQQFKNMGYTVYVLYTPYLPVPNWFYLDNVKQYTEPLASSSVVTALQACASSSSDFIQASNPTDISNAMQAMLQSMLATPARVSN